MFDKNYLLTKEDKLSNFANNPKFEYMYNPATFSIPTTQQMNSFKKDKIVIAIGRLSYQKWIDALIYAWAIISRIDKLKGWKLKILGDGPERKNLESLIEKLSISNTVELVGHVTNVEKYLESASIYCTTSRYEGLQLSLIEAMAYGCVPVAFKHPYGPKDVISDGMNGVLVDMGDIGSYASALQGLMLDPIKIKQISQNAFLRACDFSQDKIISNWMDEYYQLLSR